MVYSYLVFGVDYFWDEETGISAGIKSTYCDHFDIDSIDSTVDDVIIEFIEVLARYDSGIIFRIESNEVVAILERDGYLKLRAKSDSIFDFFTQNYVYDSDGVHLLGSVSEFIDII